LSLRSAAFVSEHGNRFKANHTRFSLQRFDTSPFPCRTAAQLGHSCCFFCHAVMKNVAKGHWPLFGLIFPTGPPNHLAMERSAFVRAMFVQRIGSSVMLKRTFMLLGATAIGLIANHALAADLPLARKAPAQASRQKMAPLLVAVRLAATTKWTHGCLAYAI
jgi:hypothetical protein